MSEAALRPEGETSVTRPPAVRQSGRSRRTILEKSGLPRLEPGRRHVDGEARAWADYLGPLVDRLGLGRPVPKWSIADLKRAGHAHLTAERLQRLLDAGPLPNEARRLRSEIRRSVSQARVAERVLSTLAAEQRAQERSRVPSVQDLLAQVGRRG